MKAAFEHIRPDLQSSSFTAYWRRTDYFDFHWHYHPEIELTYIHQGSGTRLAGDHVEEFKDGDLVLLGSDLPHTWVSESKGVEQSAIVVQFRQESLPDSLLHTPEFSGIKKLLTLARRGVVFPPETANRFAPLLSGMLGMEGLQRLTELWRILDGLAHSADWRLLASPVYRPSLGEASERRIDRACQHIHRHFTRKITLEEMAAIVSMTESSFCRFFKKMTGLAFTDYVNDLRTSRARKLLQDPEMTVADAAFASGFESTTHFNRIFHRKNGMSPRAFRKEILGRAGGQVKKTGPFRQT